MFLIQLRKAEYINDEEYNEHKKYKFKNNF